METLLQIRPPPGELYEFSSTRWAAGEILLKQYLEDGHLAGTGQRRRSIFLQLPLAMYAGKALRFTRVGEETGIAHPCKTRRENMLKETKKKLYSRNRDFFRLACFPVCNSNGYGGTVITDDSAVGYGCFESITGKIVNGVAIAIESLHDLSNPVHIVELVAKRVPQRRVKILLLVRRRYR